MGFSGIEEPGGSSVSGHEKNTFGWPHSCSRKLFRVARDGDKASSAEQVLNSTGNIVE